jgi:hypothetical protein
MCITCIVVRSTEGLYLCDEFRAYTSAPAQLTELLWLSVTVPVLDATVTG